MYNIVEYNGEIAKINNITGLNLYAYCNNNPIMYDDSDGTFAISTIVAFSIGFAIGAGIGTNVVDNLGKYKTSKTFVLANHNSIRKNAMYSAKIIAVKKTFVSSSIKYASNVVFATSMSTFLSKVFEWR